MGGKKNKKNTSGLALACWILGFLILLIVFLVKLDDIKSNLKSTRFFERIFGTTPTFIQNHEDKKKEDPPLPEENTVITLNTMPSNPAQSVQTNVPADSSVSTQPAESQPAAEKKNADASSERVQNQPASQNTVQPTPAAHQSVQQEAPSPANPDPKPVAATTTAKLCFVSIDGDGSVNRRQISRTVTKNDSPLAGNIQLLLAGPTPSERQKGCRSLIPEGTRLLTASVRDGVASLNFSEEFEYNQRVGVEGYIGQLMQIVYTATEFGTVNSVQFLIDGQKKEYLGSEGVWIGSPLSRSSF
ncbi:MAG: GerMN domain-containing protein [Treponema sp.]|nr:GerMN domain-containing protein [Treponema sp.]